MSSDLGELLSPPILINYSRSGFSLFTNKKYLNMIFFLKLSHRKANKFINTDEYNDCTKAEKFI